MGPLEMVALLGSRQSGVVPQSVKPGLSRTERYGEYEGDE